MDWVTADQHFRHGNIIKYEKRPFANRDEMDLEIIQRFNDLVGKNDTTYHLGDFALAGRDVIADLLAMLHGEHILILGNHDRSKTSMLDAGFKEVYQTHLILERGESNVIMSHRRMVDLPTINVGVDNWNYYPLPLPTVRGWYHLCGHSHGNWIATETFYIVDPDTRDLMRSIEARYREEPEDD